MSNITLTKHQFLELHACLFSKRASLLNLEPIVSLEQIEVIYQETKQNKKLKELYDYDISRNIPLKKNSLFHVIANYLIKKYPKKYNHEKLLTMTTLTKMLWGKYKTCIEESNINSISFSSDFWDIYCDFLGITSVTEIESHTKEIGIDSQSIDKKNEPIFFKGYYYTEEETQINTLLLKVQGYNATVFLSRYKINPRHQYTGQITPIGNVLSFEVKSCENDNTGTGRLSMLMYLGHNPLARLYYMDICFATYCSLVSQDKPTCGILGCEIIKGLEHESHFQDWLSPIPSYIQYFITQKDIIYQRKHRATRILWDYNYSSLKNLKESCKEELKTFDKAKKNIAQLAGVYQCYSLNTRVANKSISIAYCKLEENGTLKFRMFDARTRMIEELDGDVKIYDTAYVFSLSGLNRKVKMLFEYKDYSDTLYGVYIGVFRTDIAGGRILLKKQTNKNLIINNLKPRRIKLHSDAYKQLMSDAKFYKFFSGQLSDEYIDDPNVIQYKTKADIPLPIPSSNRKHFKLYEGTYQLLFLFKDTDEIRSCPFIINKDGYVSVKSLWSSNTNAFYEGRCFIQQDKLYVHLYYNSSENYQGMLIIQIQSESQDSKNIHLPMRLYQFIGTYSVGNYDGAITAGRVHLIQKSKDCGDFNTMETQTYPCYTKPYRPLTINGSDFDFRREFMGDNYNVIRLTKRVNESLNNTKQNQYDYVENKAKSVFPKHASLREQNYANIYFHSAIFSLEKGLKIKAKELFEKALEHGWDEDLLDGYDQEKYNLHKKNFQSVLQQFSEKYL